MVSTKLLRRQAIVMLPDFTHHEHKDFAIVISMAGTIVKFYVAINTSLIDLLLFAKQYLVCKAFTASEVYCVQYVEADNSLVSMY